MPGPEHVRRRGVRKEFTEINPSAVAASDFNTKSFSKPEETAEKQVDEPASQSRVTISLPNVEMITEDVPLKDLFIKIVQLEGLQVKPRSHFLTRKPSDMIKGFREKTTGLLEKIEHIRKKTRSNNRLTDVLRMREDVKAIEEGGCLTGGLRNLGDTTKYNRLLSMVGKRFEPHKKVTIELYPYQFPKELSDKEIAEIESIQKRAEVFETSKFFLDLKFVQDGMTVAETLDYVKTHLGGLTNPKNQRDAVYKIEKNIKLIEELKYQSADDKLSDEERNIFKRVGDVWTFFQYLLSQQAGVDNGLIFFNVFAQVQGQMQGFGNELTTLDNTIKQLNDSSKQVLTKLGDSRDKVKLQFIDGIAKELSEIEARFMK